MQNTRTVPESASPVRAYLELTEAGKVFPLHEEVVIGRDPISGWWHIECPPDAEGETCWVSGGTQYTLPEPAE